MKVSESIALAFFTSLITSYIIVMAFSKSKKQNISQLQEELQDAIEKEDYEQAAILRDIINAKI